MLSQMEKLKQYAKICKIAAFVVAVPAGALLFSNLPLAMNTVNAATGIKIDKTNFPDANFRKYISAEIDEDGNGYLSDEEISETYAIDVESCSISNLKGIEFFTALEDLDCGDNKLTSLDVSKNTELTWLACSDNQLTSLNVTNCTVLEDLYCSNNKLTKLDVSTVTDLAYLYCDHNQLTSLDLSKNADLFHLYCNNNKLTSLDLSANPRICIAVCSNNQITSLNIKNYEVISGLASGLAELDCHNNKIEVLNLTCNHGLYWAFAEGENTDYTDDDGEELPDTAVCYTDETGYELIVDRSTACVFSLECSQWYQTCGLWFYSENGYDFVTGWKQINGTWYHFDADGVMETGWVKTGKTWYYFLSSGAMATGWIQSGSTWYYLDNEGALVTGWKVIAGKWYYFDADGAMQTGWVFSGGAWYYLKKDGVMASYEYCDGYWINKDGTWTYKYRATWRGNASSGWWYGDDSGWFAVGGKYTIDGVEYTFNSRGYLK